MNMAAKMKTEINWKGYPRNFVLFSSPEVYDNPLDALWVNRHNEQVKIIGESQWQDGTHQLAPSTEVRAETSKKPTAAPGKLSAFLQGLRGKPRK
jgi:hypothetical protein